MSWYPFCCYVAQYGGPGGITFDEKPESIVEQSGDWEYDASSFTTSSSGAILAYACEVMGSPLIQFEIENDLSYDGGIRVYLSADGDFTSYICVELTKLGAYDDPDRKCANVRILTEAETIYATTVETNAFIAGAIVSVGLDLSDDTDPRIIVAGTTISIAEHFPDGMNGRGKHVGFGTTIGNTDELKFSNVVIRSYAGDCCGPMDNPLQCDEHNPCGGDGIGGNVQLHEGGLSAPAGSWQKIDDYWYAKLNPDGGHDLDWWTFSYGTGVVQATCTVPRDCGTSTTRVTKSLSIYAWFRLMPQEADCSSGGSTTVNFTLNGVANYLGALSGATVTIVQSDCKGDALVQTTTASVTHVGDGTALDPGNSLSPGECVDSESILCQETDTVSGVSRPQFPLGFIRVQIDITLNQGVICGIGTPPVDTVFRTGGEFVVQILVNGSDIAPVEPCPEE